MGANSRQIYHTLQPHPALSPVPLDSDIQAADQQAANQAVWCQLLVQGVLALLLPPEDVQNPCLRVLVSEIFAEMILGNGVGGKACEGWLIWEGITKTLQSLYPAAVPVVEQASNGQSGRLEQFGLLTTQDDVLPIDTSNSDRGWSELILQVLWQLMRGLLTVFAGARTGLNAYQNAATLPERQDQTRADRTLDMSASDASMLSERSHFIEPSQTSSKRPILEMSAWSISSRLLGLSARMPWLTGCLSLMQQLLVYGPGSVGCTNSRLDR